MAVTFVSFGYGLAVGHYRIFPFGLLRSLSHGVGLSAPGEDLADETSALDPGAGAPAVSELTEEQRSARSDLTALPYLQGYTDAPRGTNVTVYEADAAYDGFNLYNAGHAPEAYLMDMKGRILHRWRYAFEDVWPGPVGFSEAEAGKHYWRRVRVSPTGDLLAIFEGYGLIKLDKDSNLLWANKGRGHHDLFVSASGNIFLLTRESAPKDKYSNLPVEGAFLEDYIVTLSPNGQELRKVSLVKCFLDSDYTPLLVHMRKTGDIFHTNSLNYLDGRHAARYPMFKEGRFLISIRNLNAVAVVDLERAAITWALSGMWLAQHEPVLLDNGHLLLFDNEGYYGSSKVIEFDPLTQEVFWSYRGDPPEAFYSKYCGANQRLPNGNTLITESTRGRAFEITPDQEVVWEFVNPHRTGESDELIATLFEVVRLDRDDIAGLVAE